MCTAYIMYSFLVTLLAVAAAASGSDAAGRAAQVHLLPRRGMQERALCSVERRCMNKVVKCPAECPEMNPRGGRQRQACAVDCAGACAATCKDLTHTTMASNSNIASKAYHTWCNKTTHESLCVSMAQSDPRKDLNTSPQGLVVILVNAAQAKANETRMFINDALQNHTTDDDYDKSKAVFEGCLLAYNLDWVNNALKVDIQQVSDKQRCADLYDSLRTVALEVTYDCEWNLPSPISSSLSQMYQNVESLASIIEAAQQILSLIGCGTS